MWDNELPLKQYLFKTIQEQQTLYISAYVKLGSGLYKDYAIYVMTHYPFSYLRYYYLPNFIQTFHYDPGCLTWADVEKPEIMYEYYKIEENNAMLARHDILNDSKYYYHSTIRTLNFIMWIVIIGTGIAAIVKREKLVFSRDDKIVFWGLFCFAVIYYASSIFAAAMEIRYCISMHSIQFVFIYILPTKFFTNRVQNNT